MNKSFTYWSLKESFKSGFECASGIMDIPKGERAV